MLHLREDMLGRASRVARVTGVNVIPELAAGDDLSAMMTLRQMRNEPWVNVVEIPHEQSFPRSSPRERPVDAA